QQPEESLSNYLTALRDLAVPTHFGPQQDKNLREQFTAGVLSPNIPEWLLLDSNIPFEQVIERVLSIERTEMEAKELAIAIANQLTCNVDHSRRSN
ncbi:hypothetical protein HPB47_004149, partial [Ixodes persulcatus]